MCINVKYPNIQCYTYSMLPTYYIIRRSFVSYKIKCLPVSIIMSLTMNESVANVCMCRVCFCVCRYLCTY